jgi:hypothetical protein
MVSSPLLPRAALHGKGEAAAVRARRPEGELIVTNKTEVEPTRNLLTACVIGLVFGGIGVLLIVGAALAELRPSSSSLPALRPKRRPFGRAPCTMVEPWFS